jgi:hypothetical protein
MKNYIMTRSVNWLVKKNIENLQIKIITFNGFTNW